MYVYTLYVHLGLTVNNQCVFDVLFCSQVSRTVGCSWTSSGHVEVMQWNLSVMDTTGPRKCVLIVSEVDLYTKL